jgi:hypothetical protein
VGLRTNVDPSGVRLYPKSSRRMSKITLIRWEHICSSRRHVLIPNLIRLIDHTIFDPCVGPCCPSEHDLRGPPRGVAKLVGHAARATHARAIAPLLPSHRLHFPSLFNHTTRLLRLFRPLAHSPTRASTSKAASRSQSTETQSPRRAHTSLLVQSVSAPRPVRCSRRVPPRELSTRPCSRRRRLSSSARSRFLSNSCSAARVLITLILSWLGTRSICMSSD